MSVPTPTEVRDIKRYLKRVPGQLLCTLRGELKRRVNRFKLAIKPNSTGSTPAANSPYEIDISDVPFGSRLQSDFPHSNTLRLDQVEWARVEHYNFACPLGHAFDRDDLSKPEECCVRADDTGFWWERVPHHDETREPPPYGWTANSALPLPVTIQRVGRSIQGEDDGEQERQVWSSIFAARREKGKLLAMHRYISSRIEEIDEQTRSVLDARGKQLHDLEFKHIASQTLMMMEDAGIMEPDGPCEWECGPFDPVHFGATRDLFKACIIRERTSPLSVWRAQSERH
jgi:hypothetical protein